MISHKEEKKMYPSKGPIGKEVEKNGLDGKVQLKNTKDLF